MPVPWLQLIDAALGVANFARGRKSSSPPEAPPLQLEPGSGATGGIEARLASVVVAALKEAFDRDARRLDLERQQLAAERERAERALRLELQRQAGDREIGRLRLIAGVALASWIGTFVLSVRLTGLGARVSLGFGWLFLLGAIAASFVAQARVASAVDALASGDDRGGPIRAGAVALGLMICGLVLVGVAALIG
jgi:hypothetical protein